MSTGAALSFLFHFSVTSAILMKGKSGLAEGISREERHWQRCRGTCKRVFV